MGRDTAARVFAPARYLDRHRLRLREAGRALYQTRPAVAAGTRAGPAGYAAALAVVAAMPGILLATASPVLGRALGIDVRILERATLGRTAGLAAGIVVAVAISYTLRRRAVVAVGGGAAAVGSLMLTAGASSWAAVFWASVLGGAGAGSAAVVLRALLADAVPARDRVRSFGVYRAAGLLGATSVLFAAAAGGASWRKGALASAAAGLVALMAGQRLPDVPAGRSDELRLRRFVRRAIAMQWGGSNGRPKTQTRPPLPEILRRIAATTSVRRVLTAYAFAGAAAGAALAAGTELLQARWALRETSRLWATGAAAGLAAVVVLLAVMRSEEPAADREVRRLRVACGGFVAAGAAFVAAAAVPWLVVSVALLGAAGGAIALAVARLDAVLMGVVPSDARVPASALAAFYAAVFGAPIGPMYAGAVGRRFGSAWAVAAIALPLWAYAAVLIRSAARADDDLDRVIDDTVEMETIARVPSVSGPGTLPMLSCRGIEFSYGAVQVLFGIDFTVGEGEMVALLGTNGAGKSTLLRVISGLGTPQRGSVRFEGRDITFLDATSRVCLGISQIPGGKAVFGPLSVAENLRLYGFTHGRDRAAVERGIEEGFAAFPRLHERRDQPAQTLSGGEQQMLALTKAMILKPRLLAIDELSLGLAPKIVGELLEIVRGINAAGTAVVLVEQSVNVALSLVEKAYFMEKGEVRFEGRAAELLERPDILRSVFLKGAAEGMRAR